MSPRNSQQGSLYIVIVFVLVVMGFLAVSLSRIEHSNHDSHTRDVLGTQAWLTSHSINEYILTEFYPLTQPFDIESNCDPIAADIVVGAQAILATIPQCTGLSISCVQIGTLGNENYFRLETAVTCGSGLSEVQRSQEVWVREEQ